MVIHEDGRDAFTRGFKLMAHGAVPVTIWDRDGDAIAITCNAHACDIDDCVPCTQPEAEFVGLGLSCGHGWAIDGTCVNGC